MFKEQLEDLKKFYNVFTSKELAEKLNITENAVNVWTVRKKIPKKYLRQIRDRNIIQNGSNNIQVNQNNGTVNIGHTQNDICELINKLSDKKKEYFYHLIKAEILKEEL